MQIKNDLAEKRSDLVSLQRYLWNYCIQTVVTLTCLSRGDLKPLTLGSMQSKTKISGIKVLVDKFIFSCCFFLKCVSLWNSSCRQCSEATILTIFVHSIDFLKCFILHLWRHNLNWRQHRNLSNLYQRLFSQPYYQFPHGRSGSWAKNKSTNLERSVELVIARIQFRNSIGSSLEVPVASWFKQCYRLRSTKIICKQKAFNINCLTRISILKTVWLHNL